MPVDLSELESELDTLLVPGQFADYCPNGLQVQGRAEVSRLVTGVTACQALLDAAIADGADAILVHHGYFWKGESPCLTGVRRRRIGSLIRNDVSLLAYHLPLDAHPKLGNNAQLAERMGWRVTGGLEAGKSVAESIGLVGECEPATGEMLGRLLAECLGREPLHIEGRPEQISRVAWCTGAAQGYIEKAIELGMDAFVTGEVSEQTVHTARENGIHFFAAGHHATERYGVQAVGNYLASRFGLEHRFIDIENPV